MTEEENINQEAENSNGNSEENNVVDLEESRKQKEQEEMKRVIAQLNSYMKPEYMEEGFSEDNFRELYEGRQKIRKNLEEQFKQQEKIADMGIMNYVDKNFSEMLGSLGEKGLVALLTETELEKTGNQKYDNIINSLERQKNIQESAKDRKKRDEYLKELIKEDFNESERDLIYFLMDREGGNEIFKRRMLKACAISENREINDSIKGRKGISAEEAKRFLYDTATKNKSPETMKKIADIFYLKKVQEDAKNGNGKIPKDILKNIGMTDDYGYNLVA